MDITLNTKLVIGTDGQIDENASAAAFSKTLSAFKADRELEDSVIADKVAAQFDAYPGTPQPMPALVHGVLNRLNAQPDNYKSLEQKVMDYVHINSDRLQIKDKATGAVIQEAEPKGTRLFNIARGKGGGVSANVKE